MARPSRGQWAIAALTVAPTLLFLDAAVSLDAPVFLAVARQILAAPLDPFGFEMIWDPTSPLAAEFNQNPPLLSYWLAPVIAAVGEWEPALHAALLPLPLLAAFCFWGIARRLAGEGFAATAVLVTTPAFVLLGTTLMLDVPVLAAFLAAVYALLRANETEGSGWEWVAGAVAAAAGLTKYVGLSIAPLLAAGLWLLPAAGGAARRRRPGRWLRVVGVPLLVWTGWALWTDAVYGAVHFSGGLELVGGKSFDPDEFWNHLLSVPVFYGAVLLFPIFVWAERLVRARRGAEVAVAGILAGAAVVTFVLPGGAPPRRVAMGIEESVLGALGFAGACVVWGLGVAYGRAAWRTPEHRFLVLWLLGFLFFSSFVNWHVNAADALMAAPPAILLCFRHSALRPGRRTVALWTAGMFAFSLVLTASDVAQRNVYREVAARIAGEIADAPGRRWFVGHWGLQYYLERQSFEPVAPSQYARRYGASRLEVGDWLVSSRNVSQLDVAQALGPYGMKVVWRWELPAAIPLRATNPDAGAGFYSHQSGHVPFSWSRAPLEEVGLARVTSAPEPEPFSPQG
jgi:4-amino-4-deoxy-L-arabinose transferase-like glycosyltransferase